MNEPILEKAAVDEIEVIYVIQVLLSRVWIIISVVILFLVIGYFYIINVPNEYRAEAKFLVNNQKEKSLGSAIGKLGLPLIGGESSGGSESQLEVLKVYLFAYENLSKLLSEVGFRVHYSMTDAKFVELSDTFKSRLTVLFEPKSEVATLSYQDIDPKFAYKVVNYSLELLKEISLFTHQADIQRRNNDLTNRLSDVKSEMIQLELIESELMKSHGLVSFKAQLNSTIEAIGNLENELTILRIKRKVLLETGVANSHPKIKLIDRETKALSDELQRIVRGENLKRDSGFSLIKLEKISELKTKLSKIERDKAVLTEIFKGLAQQQAVSEISLKKTNEFISILQKPMIPEKKSYPKRAFFMIAVMVSSLVLCSTLILLYEFFLKDLLVAFRRHSS